MAVEGYDLLTVQGDNITVDLLVWRRYRIRAPGVVELLLDANPHLARIHVNGPFLPVGTQVRIPLDPDIMKGSPVPKAKIKLWGGRSK